MLWSCTRAWGLIWYINVHDLMLQSRCLELKSWGLEQKANCMSFLISNVARPFELCLLNL